ncbi:hypothetical protein PanWU01x14_285400 [Parasponia andersonii]|uniref:Uncharacterized protein n=1 Tax=Parasponia andersonii TaxID=3476 RepID=A0A2P5AZK8_PARAD|nr:hypothetical protein PanWU01x14_285400 [Parasponia andersonii]
MLNSSLSQLDLIFSSGKSSDDITKLGFKGECSGTKMIFVREKSVYILVSVPIVTSVCSKNVPTYVTTPAVITAGPHVAIKRGLSFVHVVAIVGKFVVNKKPVSVVAIAESSTANKIDDDKESSVAKFESDAKIYEESLLQHIRIYMHNGNEYVLKTEVWEKSVYILVSVPIVTSVCSKNAPTYVTTPAVITAGPHVAIKRGLSFVHVVAIVGKFVVNKKPVSVVAIAESSTANKIKCVLEGSRSSNNCYALSQEKGMLVVGVLKNAISGEGSYTSKGFSVNS